jgi:hypothetical protein
MALCGLSLVGVVFEELRDQWFTRGSGRGGYKKRLTELIVLVSCFSFKKHF